MAPSDKLKAIANQQSRGQAPPPVAAARMREPTREVDRVLPPSTTRPTPRCELVKFTQVFPLDKLWGAQTHPPNQRRTKTVTTSLVRRAARLFFERAAEITSTTRPETGPARTKRHPSGKAPPRRRPRTASSKAQRPRATRGRERDTGAGHPRRESAARAAVRIPHTLSAAQGEAGGSKDSGQKRLEPKCHRVTAQGTVANQQKIKAKRHRLGR